MGASTTPDRLGATLPPRASQDALLRRTTEEVQAGTVLGPFSLGNTMTAPCKYLADPPAAAFPQEVTKSEIARGELMVTVARAATLRVLTFLRDDPKCLFNMLVDVCGVDYP